MSGLDTSQAITDDASFEDEEAHAAGRKAATDATAAASAHSETVSEPVGSDAEPDER